MSLSRLTTLQLIVSKLTDYEIESLQRFLTAFEQRKEREPKTLSLLNLLLEEQDLAVAEKKLSSVLQTNSEAAIRMIILRLKEKIQEVLLLDVNINRDGAYHEIKKAEYEISKKQFVAGLLYGRGLEKEALSYLNQIIKIAKKYEYYTELIDALLYKQRILSIKKGRVAFEMMDEEIAFYERCRTARLNAKQAYYRTIQNYTFKGLNRNHPNPIYLESLSIEIKQLKQDFEFNSSPIVGFYYYLLQIEYFQIQHKYDKASEYCLHVFDIIRNNPSVNNERRLGMANLNLSQNEIFNFYFDYAAGFAREARKFFKKDTLNYSLSFEMEFYASFYAGQHERSSEIIKTMLQEQRTELSDFRRAWMHYVSACLRFIEKDYKGVNLDLNYANKVNQDKEGWNIGVRTLSILTAIEQENLDSADNQIISMQQFMRQSLKGVALRKRDEIILKVLLILRKESYQFSTTLKKCASELSLLVSDHPDLSWQVLSPELIVFHRWFDSKVKDQNYIADYSKESVLKAIPKSV